MKIVSMMKIVLLLFMSLLTTMMVRANVVINEETFPDDAFRNCVLSEAYGEDGVLTDEEIYM